MSRLLHVLPLALVTHMLLQLPETSCSSGDGGASSVPSSPPILSVAEVDAAGLVAPSAGGSTSGSAPTPIRCRQLATCGECHLREDCAWCLATPAGGACSPIDEILTDETCLLAMLDKNVTRIEDANRECGMGLARVPARLTHEIGDPVDDHNMTIHMVRPRFGERILSNVSVVVGVHPSTGPETIELCVWSVHVESGSATTPLCKRQGHTLELAPALSGLHRIHAQLYDSSRGVYVTSEATTLVLAVPREFFEAHVYSALPWRPEDYHPAWRELGRALGDAEGNASLAAEGGDLLAHAKRIHLTQPRRGIPRIMHQIWTGGEEELQHFHAELPVTDKRSHFLEWRRSCVRTHPGWKHVLWSSSDMRALVAAEVPFMLAQYDAMDTHIKRTDFARLLILWRFGGVYVDMDFECFRAIDNDIPLEAPFVVAEHFTNSIHFGGIEYPNALMGSARGHPLVWSVLVEVMRRDREDPAGFVTRISGPVVFTNMVLEWRRNFGSGSLRVVPPPVFYPVYCMNKTQMALDSQCILSRNCAEQYPSSPAVHHYAMSWFESQSRTTFSYLVRESAAAERQSNHPAAVYHWRAALGACMRCPLPDDVDAPEGSVLGSVKTFRPLPDRQYLDGPLLRALAARGPRRVLAVGVNIYSIEFEVLLRQTVLEMHGHRPTIVTLDIDAERALYGSGDVHCVGSILTPEQSSRGRNCSDGRAAFPAGGFDVIVVNGVIGWGLNTLEDVAQLVRVLKRLSAPDAVLVVGRNSRHSTPGTPETNVCCDIDIFLPHFLPTLLRAGDPSDGEHLPRRRTWVPYSDHVFDVLRLAGPGDAGAVREGLMIVAHPDDESIFGGAELLTRPLLWTVVSVTNSGNAVRRSEFARALHAAGAHGQIWDYEDCITCVPLFLPNSSSSTGWVGVDTTRPEIFSHFEERLAQLVKSKPWDRVVTHGPLGEYGHPQHRAVYLAASRRHRERGIPLHTFQTRAAEAGITRAERHGPTVAAQLEQMLSQYASQHETMRIFSSLVTSTVPVSRFNLTDALAGCTVDVHPFLRWSCESFQVGAP